MSDNQNWNTFGKQMEGALADALKTGDFKNLNRLVSRVDRIYAATTPEKAETLSNLVSQAAGEDGTTEFVPELAADSPTLTGSRLILAE